jgi:hypothetical protein
MPLGALSGVTTVPFDNAFGASALVPSIANIAGTVTGIAPGLSDIVVDAEEVPRAAVTTADCALNTAPAAPVNVADVALAGTVTDAGTVKLGEFELNATTTPEAPAAEVRLAVHADVEPGPTHCGLQLIELIAAADGAAILPPMPVMASELPADVAPSGAVTPIAMLSPPDGMVAVRTATTPFGTVSEFMP